MAACCFGSVARTRSKKTARCRFFQSIRDVTCTCILCQLRFSAPCRPTISPRLRLLVQRLIDRLAAEDGLNLGRLAPLSRIGEQPAWP